VTESGTLLFTKDDITAGKEVFSKYALMSYGTLLGNGAYYGPDFTAEYLSFLAEKLLPRELLLELANKAKSHDPAALGGKRTR
jgi:nitric oxide reductase large subunit